MNAFGRRIIIKSLSLYLFSYLLVYSFFSRIFDSFPAIILLFEFFSLFSLFVFINLERFHTLLTQLEA